MNAANQHIANSLKNALGALYHLHDAGCTVLSIELGQRNPVIQVERPSRFLQGAVFRRVVINDRITTGYVARVQGCEVRWEETMQTREVARL